MFSQHWAAIETGNCELVKMVLKEVYLNGKIKDSKILSVRYNTWFNLDFQCLFITVFIGGMAWP